MAQLQAVAEQYYAMARHIEALSVDNMLFYANHRVSIDDFTSVLDDEGKARFKCRTCAEFFHRFGHVVYFDHEFRPRSVFFRDYPTDDAEVKATFNKVARVIETSGIACPVGPIVRTKYTPAGMVGIARTGKYEHFHARPSIRVKDTFTTAAPQLANSIRILLEECNTPEALPRIAQLAAEVLACKWMGAGEQDTIKAIAKMLKLGIGMINEGHLSSELASWGIIAAGNEDIDILSAVGQMTHFNGSSLGTLVRDTAAGKPVEKAIDMHLEITHPLKFRAKEKEKVTLKELEAAGKYLLENGYMASFQRKFAKLEDLPLMWAPVPGVGTPLAEPDDFAGDTFNPFAKAIANAKPIETAPALPVVKTPTKISLRKFLAEILPTAKGLEILLGTQGYPQAFTIPTTPDTKPILAWDAGLTAGRIECPLVHNQQIPNMVYGVRSGWVPCVGFMRMPWTTETGQSTLKIAQPVYAALVYGSDERLDNVCPKSYGTVLSSELYQYRGAIDKALDGIAIQQSGEIAIGFQVSGYDAGCVLRVNNGDALVPYEIVSVD